jgi:transposase
VLHAGSKEGLIPGAALIFLSKTNNGDYHGEMNEENFLTWFEEQLLKKLEEPSIIVMDNASYHSTLAEKTPNASWRKDNIKSWLQERHIPLTSELLKVQLLEIVTRYRYLRPYSPTPVNVNCRLKCFVTLVTYCYNNVFVYFNLQLTLTGVGEYGP